MPSLKEIMGDKTRGDGTRYRRKEWSDDDWFEPIFLTPKDIWFGLTDDGYGHSYNDNDNCWELYIKPKKKKKVKMYRAILHESKSGDYWSDYQWYSDKKYSPQSRFCEVVAWQEMEIEVDDD